MIGWIRNLFYGSLRVYTPQCHPLRKKGIKGSWWLITPHVIRPSFLGGGGIWGGGTLRFSITFRHGNCGRLTQDTTLHMNEIVYSRQKKRDTHGRYWSQSVWSQRGTLILVAKSPPASWREENTKHEDVTWIWYVLTTFGNVSLTFPQKKHLNLWPTNNNPIGYWPTPPVAPWPFGRPPQHWITGFPLSMAENTWGMHCDMGSKPRFFCGLAYSLLLFFFDITSKWYYQITLPDILLLEKAALAK